MYIWRKFAAADWVRIRSGKLGQRYATLLAITERPGKAGALLEISCRTEKEARQLVREFGGSAKKLPGDWLANFARQARTKPLRIGSRLIIRSARGSSRKQKASTIIIPAETAFGTGGHATTAMCLRLLERVTRKRPAGWSLLDAGTGSGILAIAGGRLGAARVLAIDNDPLACAVAKRNAHTNGVRNIEFRTGDILKQKLTAKFDIITANLFSEILISALPKWTRHLTGTGYLILSGVLRSQERALAGALRQSGFAIQETRRRGKWIAVLAFYSGAEHRLSACAASGHFVR
jgi:ribosomal protein L11 methyltransferase